MDSDFFSAWCKGNQRWAAVRRIRDFAKPGKIHTIIPGGQSGNVFDKHYADQYQLFLNGQYRVYDMYSKAKPESTLKFTK